jgi:hypothetical protein
MMMRGMLRPKREEVTLSWRKLHNKELHNLRYARHIIRKMKTRMLRCEGACSTHGWVEKYCALCKESALTSPPGLLLIHSNLYVLCACVPVTLVFPQASSIPNLYLSILLNYVYTIYCQCSVLVQLCTLYYPFHLFTTCFGPIWPSSGGDYFRKR